MMPKLALRALFTAVTAVAAVYFEVYDQRHFRFLLFGETTAAQKHGGD